MNICPRKLVITPFQFWSSNSFRPHNDWTSFCVSGAFYGYPDCQGGSHNVKSEILGRPEDHHTFWDMGRRQREDERIIPFHSLESWEIWASIRYSVWLYYGLPTEYRIHQCSWGLAYKGKHLSPGIPINSSINSTLTHQKQKPSLYSYNSSTLKVS